MKVKRRNRYEKVIRHLTLFANAVLMNFALLHIVCASAIDCTKKSKYNPYVQKCSYGVILHGNVS